MFDSIKEKFTTSNVLIGLGAVAVVGGLAYYFLRDKDANSSADGLGSGVVEAVETLADDVVKAAEATANAAAEVTTDAANAA